MQLEHKAAVIHGGGGAADGAVAREAGRIDILLNAVGVAHVQATPPAERSLDELDKPIAAYMRTNFISAKAAARHMVRQRSGVILTLPAPGSKLAGSGFLGYGVTCAAIGALSRRLTADSHTRARRHAARAVAGARRGRRRGGIFRVGPRQRDDGHRGRPELRFAGRSRSER